MKYHIGRLLKSVRGQQRISQLKLCMGLCSTPTLSRIELGTLEADEWLVAVLFERLGIALNKFGYVFTASGLAEFEKREEVLALICEGNIEEAEKFITIYYKTEAATENYKRQFFAYLRLIIRSDSERYSENFKTEIIEALYMTLPKSQFLSDVLKEDILLGRVERALLVLLADILIQENYKEGVTLYKWILTYLENKVTDGEERVGQYPAVIALLLERMAENGDYTGFSLAKKGLELLCEQQKSHEMCSLLKYEAACYRNGNVIPTDPKRIVEVDNAIEVLEELDREYGRAVKMRSKRFAGLVRKSLRGVLLSENVQMMRQGMSLSQKRMSEGICTARTISRIENEEVEPSLYVCRGLMNKLEQEEFRYYSVIKSDDIRMHELNTKLVDLISRFDYNGAGLVIDELEKGLDLEDKWNRQAVMRYHFLIDAALGKIDRKAEKEGLETALYLTVPKNVSIEEWPLKDTEIALINNIANVKAALGDINGAIEFLKKAKAAYDNSSVSVLQNVAKYLLVIYNLTGYLGELGEYKEAYTLAESSMKIACCAERSYDMVIFWFKKILYLDEISKEKSESREIRTKTYLPAFKRVFILASIVKWEFVARHIYNHCKDEYGIEIDCY